MESSRRRGESRVQLPPRTARAEAYSGQVWSRGVSGHRYPNDGRRTSRAGDLLVRGGRHACLPGRIAQFEHVAARIQEVQLSPREETVLAVDEFDNVDALSREELAGLFEHLGADRK